MGELANCLNCNAVFVKLVRNICQKCFRKEEEAYEKVYRFLLKRKNRQATIVEISEATDVEEELIIKFLKEKRLQAAQFPNLKYPCEKCQEPISSNNICEKCRDEMRRELQRHEEREKVQRDRDKEKINVYYHFKSKDHY